MQSKLNQAITLHPLFFDPVNKKALLMKKNGKEFVGYQEDRPGIIVTKNNEVISYEKFLLETRAVTDNMYFYPIPNTERFKNPNLGQNPGW